MSYIVFARKWRPQKFDEIVGQEHITTTLKNAIDLKRIAHAYIFTGPRGVGKTSTARIFAKALNCAKGPSPIPCNKCTSCKEITKGSSMDVLEIDGASNRGIEEIRNLRENVKFAPVNGKFKIYIIDEVHMLTTEAFNALLKTLEEPPLHVKFVFATTMPHKVPATILSRCQRFDFRRISDTKIIQKLLFITKKEGIKIDEDALFAIAKASDGSLRDAESSLDQLVNLYDKKITSDGVTKVLGVISQSVMFDFVDNIRKSNTSYVLGIINDLVNQGKDISRFTTDLCEYFRNILMVKIVSGNTEGLFFLTKEYKAKITKQADSFTKQELFYIINILLDVHSKMRYVAIPKIPLELAVAKLTHRQNIVEVDDILAKFDELKNALSSGKNCFEDKNPDTVQAKEVPAGGTKTKDENLSNSSSLNLERLEKSWPDILSKIKEKRMSLGLYLACAKVLDIRGSKIILGFDSKFHKKALEKNKKFIESVLNETLNQDLSIACENIIKKAKAKGKKNLEEKDAKPILDNEIVKSAIDMFKGKIIFNGKVDSIGEENI